MSAGRLGGACLCRTAVLQTLLAVHLCLPCHASSLFCGGGEAMSEEEVVGRY